MTSMFLNEHLSNSGDRRRYICVDTFSGFTKDHIAFEVSDRAKNESQFRGQFSINSAKVFKRNLSKHDRTVVLQKDCGFLTREDLGAVSVALLDVDLYQPTSRALRVLYDSLQIGGEILVDDVSIGHRYDGAHAAYVRSAAARAIRIECRIRGVR
jgi:hypothetical protein